MRFEAVILANAAENRENLLYVLGGGFECAVAHALPCLILLTVGGVFLHEFEDPPTVALTVGVTNPGGRECGGSELMYPSIAASEPAPRRRVFTLPVQFEADELGLYSVHIHGDGANAVLPLRVIR